METVPEHIAKLLQINAHPKFLKDWIDHFDDIYTKINRWIDRAQLSDDRDEMQKIAAWMAPCLCSNPTGPEHMKPADAEHYRAEWQAILKDLEGLFTNDPFHSRLSLRKSAAEQRIAQARKHREDFLPKRGRRRKVLDEGLGLLFRRMEERGRSLFAQEHAVFELFKEFHFCNYNRLSTDEAYHNIDMMHDRIMKRFSGQPQNIAS